jgi:hypothetical protein
MKYRERQNGVNLHVFTVFDGATTFKLCLDPETLLWTLAAVADGEG